MYVPKYEATVIINTVNEDPKILSEAIQSYVNQENVRLQIIVSTVENDVSIQVAKAFPEVQVLVNPVKGIYAQLNRAIHYVQGEWYCYASGNDVAYSHKIRMEIDCAKSSGAKVCYSNFDKVTINDNVPGIPVKTNYYPYDYEKHLTIGNFVNDCAIVHYTLLEKYCPFQNFDWHNDSYFDFWLRIAHGEGPGVFVFNPVSTWLYKEWNNSKHIERQKNPSELQVYAQIRERLLANHRKGHINNPTEKYELGKQI